MGERAATAPLILLAACFSLEAVDVATYDRFSPLTYALYASEHPGTRVITFQLRAGMVVDGLAGPHDTIAVDAGFDTWMYPAMGAHWTRRLEFIPAGEGKPHIPDDADWVIVDRSWNAIWGNPRLTDLGQYWQYIGKGTPTPDDVRVYDALRTDRRFILAYDDRELNQAVFRRFKPPS